MANRVTVIHDVSIEAYGPAHRLHFQWGLFQMDKETAYGYRFMWSENGKLKALRGGARIPSWEQMQQLLTMATKAGWAGKSEGDR